MTQLANFPGGTAPRSAPSVPNAFLSFQGRDPASGKTERFDVLCGADNPKITGGYAEWSIVPRPLQRSLTIPKDFPPVQMTCQVIFGSWLGQYGLGRGWQTSDSTGQLVEDDISRLEWMAGGGGVDGQVAGQAPWVYVFSYSSASDRAQSGLIPVKYRGLPWVVTSLTWGQARTNQNGYRVYQEATVQLTNFLSLTPASGATTDAGGSWFISSPGRDTALRIVASPAIASPTVDYQSAARSILRSPSNNPCKGTSISLQGRSPYFTIRHGVRVYVPAHTVT